MSIRTQHKVLAIDPGYDRLGVAVFVGNTLTHSECVTPKSKDFGERLQTIYTHVTALIEKEKPDAIALETLFFSKNVKTAIKVAEARGVIVLTAARAQVPLYEYSPQAVKMAVTGSGSADKKSVIKMIELTMKLPPKKRLDDEYDAIALGLAHQTSAIHKGF